MKKKWNLREKISQKFEAQFPEVNSVILQLLYNRGLKTQEEIDEFLMPDYSQDLHDPFLFQDMTKAVERIFKAIKGGEKILVYGDYDTDGITSAALLKIVLEALGAKNLEVRLPDRESEGYGLNKGAIEEIAKKKVMLIITCDCGITNKEEVELANNLGMDVIVTDHHEETTELPPAYAIIDAKIKREKYLFKNLAGVGVAFKLAQALIHEFTFTRQSFAPQNLGGQAGTRNDTNNGTNWEGFEKWLLDLVAIGTVGDMCVLLGENRTLVRYGLMVLNKTKRLGLRKLIEVADLSREGKLDAHSISFGLSPRLNAAGRLNHANNAYKLLVTDEEEEAGELATELNESNGARRRLTDEMLKESLKQIGEVKNQKILFALGNDWLVGMVGLVAGKICDEYNRPVIVMTRRGNEITGSGRSILGFDIVGALEEIKEFFIKFGGHKEACGFTLKNIEDLEKFKRELTQITEKELKGKDLLPVLSIDTEITLQDINWEFLEAFQSFRPFGEGNPKPCFFIKNLKLEDIRKVGQNGGHLKLKVSQMFQKGKKVFDAIGFGLGEWAEKLRFGQEIDMVSNIEANEWNGTKELQLKIVDLKLSD